MANETSTADRLRPDPSTPSTSLTPPSTALYDLSAGLMGQITKLGEQRAQRLETSAADVEKEASALATKAKDDEAARAAAKVTPPTTTPPPSTKARPFLEPGDSLIGQLQNVMQGIGLLALGIAGGKGTGYAIAATEALKGAAEGWSQGDGLRVERELKMWQAAHKQLMDQYQMERDAFNDLLTSQKLSMTDRFAQMRMRAEVMGLKDLADQARQENLTGVLNYLQATDKLALDHQKLAAEIENWRRQAEQHQQNYIQTEARAAETRAHNAETEARARESGARSERRTRLAEETSGNLMKLQQSELGLMTQIDNLAQLRDAIAIVDGKGAMAKGTTFWDKAQAAIALQSHPGDQELAAAVEVIKRFGTPSLLKTEMALGIQGSQLRVKSIIEAEAGNVLGIPRAFWDQFLPKAEARFREQLAVTREHLKGLGRLSIPSEDNVTIERVE